MMKKIFKIVGFAAMLTSLPVNAALIATGATGLLSQSGADQLEIWLGSPLTLNNIFTKGALSTSANFHAAADGQGATFSLMNVTLGGITKTIGGYNSQSWSSAGTWNTVINPVDRTAFIFNLTDTAKYSQRTDAFGNLQTFNDANYGPTFGSGFDLSVGGSLTTATSSTVTYGNTFFLSIFDGLANTGIPMTVNGLEVFSIAGGGASVPEPGSAPLLLTGLGLVAFISRRNRLY
jgi:hypothetical protein